ncbi:MAG: amidophosphoribosyltransferase [Gracilibacteraceae bacterium]|jgi:amidophosphoribosyltransferase|nr:amidophosphoribosyltransferase [Gracilibacteraceae bacterium]
MNSDKPREECGVFGIYAPEQDTARLTYFGLYALQHRGQESAGIAVSDGRRINVHKAMGLVAEVFADDALITGLRGKMALGHVRYSTTGSSLLANAQPLVVHFQHGMMALAHNGNLTNATSLKEELCRRGVVFHSTTDSEIILNLIAGYKRHNLEDAVIKTMMDIRGAYAILVMGDGKIIGARDPHGIRPLCIGVLEGRYCFASESCALDVIGAEFVRDVRPGEVATISAEGLSSLQSMSGSETAHCSFEYIYLARPDSTMDKVNVWESRFRMGRQLALEYPLEADLVIPVPDSGTPAALGYAQTTGRHFAEGLMKNRYVGRTFIQPTQEMRENSVRIKLNGNERVLRGKNVVMVDDSIVRGTTSLKLIQLVRHCGAREVHMLISSPPVRHSCYYGIDTAERERLIANNMDVEGIRRFIGADSLYYLSEAGLRAALRDRDYCMACFTGVYPVAPPRGQCKDSLESVSDC